MSNKTHKVLVTGSIAIDITGLYPGSFEAYSQQYDINNFNASFQLSGVKTGLGGCCLNIAYGLNLLGIQPLPLSSAGRDFRDAYEPYIRAQGINTDFIAINDDAPHGATCLMINDRDGNQIIGFFPGEPNPARLLPSEVPGISDISWALLAPEEAEIMLRQARDLAALDVPVMLDPGQVITDFTGQEIVELLSLSSMLLANEHEFHALARNAGMSTDEVLEGISQAVITRSERGVDIYSDGTSTHVDALQDIDIVEVTGCGDAFRAGFVYGLCTHDDIRIAAEYGCVMAATNLESNGTQSYQINAESLTQRHHLHYGASG